MDHNKLWKILKEMGIADHLTCLLRNLYAGQEATVRMIRASLVAQPIKNLPAMQETSVPSLGWKDLLEKGMATHSSILAWRIPGTGEPGGCSLWGRTELDTTEATYLFLKVSL